MENYFQKLTKLQNSVGYVTGPINMIALLGLAGESGEVLEEFFKEKVMSLEMWTPEETISQYITVSKRIDNLKKRIRDSEKDSTSVSPEIASHSFSEELFDKEIADTLYYLNALAINRGKTLEEYAKISFDKVSAKIQQNISHGINHKEMPPQENEANK
jgi:NTP pyrophosphatase (non-canonical NTP hydrolase)